MIIETDKFKKNLTTILPGIQTGKVTIEGADLVIFSEGKMLSYNSKVATSVPLDVGANFGVKAKDLYNLVAKIKAETIELEPDVAGNKLKVKSGNLKATLIMQDTSVIMKVISKLTFGQEKPLPKKFVEATKLVAIADNNTKFKGFAVGRIKDKTMLISTDKVRISAYDLGEEMTQLMVDDDLLNQAVSFGAPTTYSIVGPWMHIGYADGMHYSMLRSDDTSFQYEGLGNALTTCQNLEAIAKFTFPSSLGEVADRVTTMANTDANSKIQCQLKIETDKLTVIAEKSTGTAEEEIKWEKPAEVAEAINVWLPVKTLLALNDKSPTCKVVQMGPGRRALVIMTDVYTMVASCNNISK